MTMITVGFIIGCLVFVAFAAVAAADGPSGCCHECGGYPSQCECLLANNKKEEQ